MFDIVLINALFYLNPLLCRCPTKFDVAIKVTSVFLIILIADGQLPAALPNQPICALLFKRVAFALGHGELAAFEMHARPDWFCCRATHPIKSSVGCA